MLRITKQSDYAVVLMTTLAHAAPDEQINARDLAQYNDLPAPMVSKILKQLARAELVHSTRGAHGGYALARPATDISLAELLHALEGPMSITECSVGTCRREGTCKTRNKWRAINDQIRTLLESVSLAEMTDDSPLLMQMIVAGSKASVA